MFLPFRLPQLSRDLSQGSRYLSACCSLWKLKKGESYVDFEWLMCHGLLVPLSLQDSSWLPLALG